jgi:cytochrome c peroxidase
MGQTTGGGCAECHVPCAETVCRVPCAVWGAGWADRHLGSGLRPASVFSIDLFWSGRVGSGRVGSG